MVKWMRGYMDKIKLILNMSSLLITITGTLYPIKFPLKQILNKTKGWGGINDKDIEIFESNFIRSTTISRTYICIGILFQIIIGFL